MTCRLFIDEVGNDDTRHPGERYLSVTGIITKKVAHDRPITTEIEVLKIDLFGHNPPQWTVILHRNEIVRRVLPFDCLPDPKVNAEWERRILGLIEDLPYSSSNDMCYGSIATSSPVMLSPNLASKR